MTTLPTIYHPHDLQHVHLPQFLSAEQRDERELWYGSLSRQAAMVAVASKWTKQDVESHFDLPSDRVRVIPLAPPTAAVRRPTEAEIVEASRRLALPESFILYPAQTWPHKNHIGLLRALAWLRDRHQLVVPLVASGHRNSFFSELERCATELGISDSIRWLGFVEPADLQVLYARARAVVIPTRFEAASAPLWEAFLAGVPAACSNVTSLPDQAGDAAIVFDPDSVEEMGEAIRRLWLDDELRAKLVAAGRRRVGEFTWDRTARTFRAHYRRIAGRALTEEDRHLLAADPPL